MYKEGDDKYDCIILKRIQKWSINLIDGETFC